MMDKAGRWWWIVLLLAAGCTGSSNEVVVRPSGVGSAEGEGEEKGAEDEMEGLPTEGQVCRVGSRPIPAVEGEEGAAVVTCGEGLGCCYPCGMAGCDWVCATPESCESWRTLP